MSTRDETAIIRSLTELFFSAMISALYNAKSDILDKLEDMEEEDEDTGAEGTEG